MRNVSVAHNATECESDAYINNDECEREHVEETCWSFLYKHLMIAGYRTPISSRRYIYSNRPNTGIIRWGSDILGMCIVASGLIYVICKMRFLRQN